MSKVAKKPVAEMQRVEVPSESMLETLLAPVKRDAEETLAELKELAVTTPTEMSAAGEMLKEVAHRHTKWEGEKKEMTTSLKSVTSKIDAIYRPVLQTLDACVELLKDKLAACTVALESERSKLLKASTLAGPGKKAEALVAQAEAFVIPKIQGVGITPTWTGEVVDAEKIPREYLVPDVKKLADITAAMGRDPGIAGWRAYVTADVRTTRQGR